MISFLGGGRGVGGLSPSHCPSFTANWAFLYSAPLLPLLTSCLCLGIGVSDFFRAVLSEMKVVYVHWLVSIASPSNVDQTLKLGTARVNNPFKYI